MVGALGNAMIESVKIENFRCFSELEVHGLKPVNILVGDNASGKSAFLEALYMVLEGLPSNSFPLREWRQMGLPDRSAQESSQIWDDLFHNYDSSRKISILAGDRITLKIYRNSSGVKFDRFSDTGEPGLPSPGRKPFSTSFTRAELTVPATCEYLGPHSLHAPQWLASRFSDLSKEGETAPILDALRSEYPFLRDLSLELDAGNPSVFASIEGSKRKFPAALVSDGFNKLLSILLCVACASNGTLLIDQIEDGFYFKKMPSIWKIIHGFAKENATQIFATTHSKECLDALLPVIEKNEEDFALIRASRFENSIKFSVNNGRRFASALSQEFELR